MYHIYMTAWYSLLLAPPPTHTQSHLVVDVQGVVGAVGELAHELLKVIINLFHHLSQTTALHPTKLHLLQLQELEHCLEVVLNGHVVREA